MKEHDISGGGGGGGDGSTWVDPVDKVLIQPNNPTLCASNFIALFPSATMNTNFIFYFIAVKL